jgi:hypothetical protein
VAFQGDFNRFMMKMVRDFRGRALDPEFAHFPCSELDSTPPWHARDGGAISLHSCWCCGEFAGNFCPDSKPSDAGRRGGENAAVSTARGMMRSDARP